MVREIQVASIEEKDSFIFSFDLLEQETDIDPSPMTKKKSPIQITGYDECVNACVCDCHNRDYCRNACS